MGCVVEDTSTEPAQQIMTLSDTTNDYGSQPKRARKNQKNLIINAFLMGSPGCQTIGSWRHPDDKSEEYLTNPKFWTDLAKTLEKGKFHAVFFADVLGSYDVYQGPSNIGPVAKAGSQWPILDPSYFIPLMASVTKDLSFGMTISTISEEPYHLSRRLGTIDLITNGRVGWNIVTSYLESAARNLLNGKDLPGNNERYAKAEEYVDVVYKLFLSSWRDGAVKINKKEGIFTDPKGLRHIKHKGEFFDVLGPNITPPSRQKLPVIIQAGTSPKGKELAARNAEIVFLSQLTPDKLVGPIKEIKTIAKEKFGRDPSKIKFLALMTVVLGDTHEQAVAKVKQFKEEFGDVEAAKAMFSGWTGVNLDLFEDDQPLENVEHLALASSIKRWSGQHPTIKKWTKDTIADSILVGGSGALIIGTPAEVADELGRWVEVSDIDGFNLAYTVLPQSYEEISEKLLPELQKRGLFRHEYPKSETPGQGPTFREQLFGTSKLDETHPASGLSWNENEEAEEFEERFEAAYNKLKGIKN